jgi:transposase
MAETTMFIGLDVHKATIAVAIAEGGRREAARYFGEMENTSAALSKLAKKYGRSNVRLSFCYEAGRAVTVSIVTSSISATNAWWSRRP